MIILGICTELCVHLYFYSSLQFTSVHILILGFAGVLFQPLVSCLHKYINAKKRESVMQLHFLHHDQGAGGT